MATIILNGVETDANPLSATGQNDKLTVSGSLNGYDADMLAGNDLVEIDQAGEESKASTIKGGEGNDVLYVNNTAFGATTSDITLSGGAGDDAIHAGMAVVPAAEDGRVTFTGKINGNDGDDSIRVVRSDGATAQGGGGDDVIQLGSNVDLDGPGSRGDSTVDNSSVNGGQGDDHIHFLSSVKADQSTINGGFGEDTLRIDGSLTGVDGLGGVANENGFSSTSLANTGDGNDHIHIAEGASLVNTLINGNSNKDYITSGELESAEGSIIAGGSGHDHISVANAGALTVRGGKGKDMLRVGSGQTVVGGDNADTFSIEFEGGAVIEDFNRKEGKEDCYCSDVIQVDGNKINYDTYEYKATKEKYTALSSYVGNIRVKAFEEPVVDTCIVKVDTEAAKTATITATAVGRWKVTKTDLEWNNTRELFENLPNASFPNIFDGTIAGGAQRREINGNSPRPNATVQNIGFGYGEVQGVVAAVGGTEQNITREILVPNLTVYTRTKFEKGDFSFLDQNVFDTCQVRVKQELKFDDVTRGTITNHWVSFGAQKNTDNVTLYDLKFGTNNFDSIRTGKANLVITKGIDNKTYYPTPGQLTNDPKNQDGIIGNTNQTPGGKYVYTRTKVATAKAGATLALSSERFFLYTKANSGFGRTNQIGDTVTRRNDAGTRGIIGFITEEKYAKYSREGFALNGVGNLLPIGEGNGVLWNSAQEFGLLTHTVSVNPIPGAQVLPGQIGPDMNFFNSQTAELRSWANIDDARNRTNRLPLSFTVDGPVTGNIDVRRVQQADGIVYYKQLNAAKTANLDITANTKGSLIAKISANDLGTAKATVSLESWLGRAQIKNGQEFTPDTCNFDGPLTANNIAGGFGGDQHNKWTPASKTIDGIVQKSSKGVFGTKYLWTSNRGVRLNDVTTTLRVGNPLPGEEIPAGNNIIADLQNSNGCETVSGFVPFECSSTFANTERVIAKTAILGRNGLGNESGLVFQANASRNRAFFSAPSFNTNQLAAAGMGDYAENAQGAPFRILFFDNAGADNGLYVMSGSANYKNGNVTAINTAPTHASGMGGKQTIVNVTGGKGFEIGLDDINFV